MHEQHFRVASPAAPRDDAPGRAHDGRVFHLNQLPATGGAPIRRVVENPTRSLCLTQVRSR
jgi:hypothetical protein